MTNKFPHNRYISTDEARNDTFVSDDRTHLDNCGASLMPRSVIETIQQHLMLEANVGGYVGAERAAVELESVYDKLAGVFGGGKDDYALAGSAVDAWTKLFYSLPITKNNNIVTAYNEYCSNYVAYLHHAKRIGFEIRVAMPGADGELDLNHLESLIDDNTSLISLSHVSSSSGQINPVKEVGKVAKRHNIPYLLDMCQSVGQIPVNVEDIGCDMATATARKFLRGPRGMGFMYINEKMRSTLDPLVMTNQSAAWTASDDYEMRTDARVFEAWERSITGQLGFGAALDYLMMIGPEKAFQQTHAVAKWAREELSKRNDVDMVCPEGSQAAIITFNKVGMSAADVKQKLEELGVAVQIASVVHTRIDLEARGVDSAVRISPHYYNSEQDFEHFFQALSEIG